MDNQKILSDSPDLIQPGQDNSLITARILSQTPGRIRIRVFLSPRQTEQIKLIVNRLKNQLGIVRVRENVHAGSVTVFYQPQSINDAQMCEILQNSGLIFPDSLEKCSEIPRTSSAAMELTKVSTNLNQIIRQATYGGVDLAFLMPLALLVLAVRQLSLRGWQFELIPWYVLAWYAFDSFIKLHGIGIDRPSVPVGVEGNREIRV